MDRTIKEWLLEYRTEWTIGLILFALAFSLLVMTIIWISTERRLWRATRTETIIDHRHSTPTTVDFVITNPLKMKGYHGSFFDPYEFHLTYGKENVKFKMEYIGRMGNNYKYRIFDLKPSSVYTDVKIYMGEKTFMKQGVVNIWTRDEKDRIISIKEAIPIDPEIKQVVHKAENIVQRKVNEGYFQYAIHYGNSKSRWIDVQDKLVKSTTKKATTAAKKAATKPAAKKAPSKKTTTKATTKK